ncbi:MAG: hypothetical protein KatS3mg093_406 [Candidatus Parcubacteria bacterium]|nr:MAG: hypothetical protein KatS3mg093_406 [Candidatus Parcubacteria bacterium]GIW67070.1 MAG: hypothetical protein KatS3mg095_0968 [Candidatus Parcubacteria bacterium]GIW67099.1 MAG: hypothetical protein KatS3mg095_0997 [Candidatus Parcubacteria bacterium]
MIEDLKKFLIYGIGGGFGFLTTFSLTIFLTEKLKFYYLISAILGYLSGIFINFIFQAFITFKTKEKLFFIRFLKFLIFQLFGLTIYSILMFFFTDILKIYYIFSLFFSTGIVYIINFTLAKNFVFR